MRSRLVLIALLLSFAVALAARSALAPAAVRFQEDEETRLSREFRREAKRKLKLVSHPEVQRYVDQIGRNILAASGPQLYEYRFFVVEDPQVNAFAVPGGSIYLYTGLIEKVNATDQLAAVIGHEIVHVKGKHMARMAGPDLLSLAGLLGIFLGGSGGQALGALGQALALTRQLAYSRQLEQEADILGTKYMAQAGYDPAAAVAFLNLIAQERILNPVDLPPYLMTHPLTPDRIASVEAAIRSLRLERPRVETLDPLKKIQLILLLERREAGALVAAYEGSAGKNPDDAASRHLLGVAYHHQGLWDKARHHYESARAAEPASPGIDRDLGRLYTQTGEFRAAHQAFERALKREPREPLNYFYLGELFEKESRLPEAAGAYANAHNLAPLWPDPVQRLGTVYGKLNRLGEAHYYLGLSLVLQDEEEKAVPHWERSIKAFGENSPRGRAIREELALIRKRK
jgi:predicted Zn-dependent protease